MRLLFKALLAATALIPVATAASAQEAPRERGDRGDRGERGERRQRPQAQQQAQAQPQLQPQAQPQAQPRQQRAPDQPPRVGVDRDMARGADWYGARAQQPGANPRQARPGVDVGANGQTGRGGVQVRGDAGAGSQQDRARQDAGRRDYRPLPAANGQRDLDWNGNRGGNGQWRGNDGRGNNGRGDRFDDRGGNRNWTNEWRNDRRYDWGRYRTDNRSAYRLPRYYAPYGWNQGYRRFSVGITLNAILFGQNYWIDDPYAYRLPDAYGPYRWVRYYNDALLVDVRYGRVVDVVHDIFW